MENKYFVKLLLTDLNTGHIRLIERNNVTEDDMRKLWDKHQLSTMRGASTSNLGYEPDDTAKYWTSTGFVTATNKVACWLQWEIKSPTVYKCRGLEIYAINCNSAKMAAALLLNNRIGVTENDLEPFTGNIPTTARVHDFNEDF